MWTRGKTDDGRFSFEVYGLDNELVASGVRDTAQEADRAAEQAQRQVFFPTDPYPHGEIDDDVSRMTDAELIAALTE